MYGFGYIEFMVPALVKDFFLSQVINYLEGILPFKEMVKEKK